MQGNSLRIQIFLQVTMTLKLRNGTKNQKNKWAMKFYPLQKEKNSHICVLPMYYFYFQSPAYMGITEANK